MSNRALRVIGVAASILISAIASATPVSYTLFYTTFQGGQNVWRVDVSYDGDGTAGNGTFNLANDTNIASTGGADGIVLNPNNGNLLVGGQGFAVHEVDPATGSFTSVNPNVPAFHLAVDPGKQVVWVSSIPGALASVPIAPDLSGAGTVLALSGDDTAITSLAFTPSGTVFYTASGSGGFGSFGSIDLSTGLTTRYQTNVAAAHGMQFDPFTGHLILVGDSTISQIDPAAPTAIVSSAVFSGVNFDQGALDGLGHLFVASNTGSLLFMDYSTTGLVGGTGNFTALPFLRSALDDVAPLIGGGGTSCGLPGQPPCRTPEPGSLPLLALGAAMLILASARRRGTSGARAG
jgi:WD40 repeat protein